MPDSRTHRGPHPEDARLFAEDLGDRLRHAVDDLSWLLGRGYSAPSALALVGDRYQLEARQRAAVQRCACAAEALEGRALRHVPLDRVRDRPLHVDGYNVLLTVEAALAGAVVLAGRDRCYRDMASVHGSYRKVAETRPALLHIGERLRQAGVTRCVWYLDRPVGNSGRLRRLMGETAAAEGWDWEVHLVPDPDAVLAAHPGVVATADSAILDRAAAWTDLARETVHARVPAAWVLDLGAGRT